MLAMPLAAQAGVRVQNPHEVLDPAIVSPTYVNQLPAAVDITPLLLRTTSDTAPVKVSGTMAQKLSATVPVSAALPLGIAAPQQCLAGLRVIAELALVAYQARPNRVFMRVATHAAVAEPYAASNVPPDLKGLTGAIGDMPFSGAGVREINQAFVMTKTACAAMKK